MFQATRRRLALWYTTVTAVLILLFATGFYWYVRDTLVERIDDTLNHVVEVVQRSLVIEPLESDLTIAETTREPVLHVNIDASFRSNAAAVEDDHIDLEWFSSTGNLLWSTFSAPIDIPLHQSNGETVRVERAWGNEAESWTEADRGKLRQVTQRLQVGQQVLGYLRVSHPWFEVSKPSQQLIRDLAVGTVLVVATVAAIGWFLSGLAIAPVRESYQQLKQFTADASHELRNPIAVIQTNVQVALADPDPHMYQDQLQVVERLTRRLGRLVDDLLFLARQDGGITALRREPVDLNELVQEVVEEQKAIASEKSLSLLLIASHFPANGSHLPASSKEFVKDSGAPLLIQADRDQITRLLTNLISNAVRYTPPGGQVEVSVQRSKQPGNSQVQVLVKDTGIGISAESLPHLFDRFYRVDPARTYSDMQQDSLEATAGSGLGLAIAKVIVENHQGLIQVESSLNQGTTFAVTLPL
ncbi:MAG: sensor histidine kinase [Drouetiella hepatica Uher 2000/2452]|jgi:OmpR-family two-component system manganese-sensing sensor histidine kinase|uniref:histidine kinase n=1 Tax=Drouetiella hepatica Uher 2000/2452 TaxID=904376 RepID=A0A951UP35_9CYAN|nr:sensor histidine kinase [Drouetiella hepatica Uher 2000/2452]